MYVKFKLLLDGFILNNRMAPRKTSECACFIVSQDGH